MQLHTMIFSEKTGWSENKFPDIDSEGALIIIFGGPKILNNLAPLQQLKESFPKSKMIGCSTAGEIFGSIIYDDSLVVAIAKFEKNYN